MNYHNNQPLVGKAKRNGWHSDYRDIYATEQPAAFLYGLFLVQGSS